LVTYIPGQIRQGHLGQVAARGAGVDDSRAAIGEQLRPEQVGEQEVADVVGAELQLDVLLGLGVCGNAHDTTIVEQDIDVVRTGSHRLRSFPNRVEVS
jgi:hypothetical protein